MRGTTMLVAIAAMAAALISGMAGRADAQLAVLSVFEQAESPPPVAGTALTYTIVVSNESAVDGVDVSLTDPLPPAVGFVSVAAPPGWACATPAPGGTGSMTCTAALVPPGSAVFTLVVGVPASVPAGTLLSNTVTLAGTNLVPLDELSFTLDLLVVTRADVDLAAVAAPSPAVAGTDLTYTLTVTQPGPSDVVAAVTDSLPAGTTFQSLAAPGWSCTTPAVGSPGTVSCARPLLAAASTAVLTLVVRVDPATPGGATLTNTATLSSDAEDPDTGNNVATTGTAVVARTDLSVTKSAAPARVVLTGAPADLTYTLTVVNGGPSTALSVSVADPLSAGTTFQSLAPPAGWACLTPAVGGTGTVSCMTPAMAPGSTAVLTLVVRVDPGTPGGTTLTNTATVSSVTADPDPANNASAAETPMVVEADVSIAKSVAPGFVLARPSTALAYTLVVANGGPSPAATAGQGRSC